MVGNFVGVLLLKLYVPSCPFLPYMYLRALFMSLSARFYHILSAGTTAKLPVVQGTRFLLTVPRKLCIFQGPQIFLRCS